jgi:signal transduction histidine kinase
LGTRYLGQERIVEVTVSDSGVGIEPGRIKMVFDPFYTTKRGGVGTGLGLSIVYGIIKKYKGDLLVDSTVGEGTRIICRLPVV